MPAHALTEFTFPAPAKLINANARSHWATRASLTKLWRDAAHVYATKARCPRLQRARVELSFHFADRRRRDVGNLQPTAKAIVDGLIDAHVLPDDNDEHLVGPDVRRGTPAGRWPSVTVRLEALP